MKLHTTAEDTLCGGYWDIHGMTLTRLSDSSNLPNPFTENLVLSIAQALLALKEIEKT